MKTKLLITGGNGQLGWEFTQIKISHFEIIALTRNELDITNAEQISKQFNYWQPDVVINTAAYTAVDTAEQERELTYKINHAGPLLLAKECAAKNIPLIHLSTDYVFAGSAYHPYKEIDSTAPLNVYGESKLAGEIAIRENCERHIILRVSGIFGIHGHNFVKTILQLAREKTELRIVDDQIICPTPANKIAETIIIICETIQQQNNLWGTYHYCSLPPTHWYQFAASIINLAKDYQPLTLKQLTAIPTKDYSTPAKRPAYSVLDCNKLKNNFSIAQCDWHTSLGEIVTKLCKHS